MTTKPLLFNGVQPKKVQRHRCAECGDVDTVFLVQVNRGEKSKVFHFCSKFCMVRGIRHAYGDGDDD